jgi:hypothetical protein
VTCKKKIATTFQARRHQQCAAPAARADSNESATQVGKSVTQVRGSVMQVRSFEGVQDSAEIDPAAFSDEAHRLYASPLNAQESPRSQHLINQLRAQLVAASDTKP